VSIRTAKKPDGPYIDGIFNINLAAGRTKTLYLKAKNGTGEAADVVLGNDALFGAGYKPKWFYKGNNITQVVKEQDYDFTLKAGRVRKFRMTVKRAQVSDADACILSTLRKPDNSHLDTSFLQANNEIVCP
jgi:hypothetical protein